MTNNKDIIEIYTEPTPNPETMKFVFNREIYAEQSADFPTIESTSYSPLAKNLFEFSFVNGVFIMNDFENAFKEVDFIISPTTPDTAFRLGEKIEDPLSMYLNDIYTASVNLAGIPAISIPSGKDRNGLPFGIQVMGRKFDEEGLLRIWNELGS